MKYKLVLMVFAALAAAGCATTYWTKARFSQQEFRLDDYNCERDMRQSGYFGIWPAGALNAKAFYDRCMEAKGYSKVTPDHIQPGDGWTPSLEPQPPDGSPAPSTASAPPPKAEAAHVAGPHNLSGTFAGDMAGLHAERPFSQRVTFTIVQAGDQIAGAWTTTGGTSGTITGRVRGDRLLDLRAQQINPCGGEFLGAATLDDAGIMLRGSYTGSDCSDAVSASFVVTRQ